MNANTRGDLVAEALDPNWTHFSRCPHCAARTFACCADHAIEGMRGHIDRHHLGAPAVEMGEQ